MSPLPIPQDLISTEPEEQALLQLQEDIRVIDDRIKYLPELDENTPVESLNQIRQIFIEKDRLLAIKSHLIQSISPELIDKVNKEWELIEEANNELQRQSATEEKTELKPHSSEVKESFDFLYPPKLSRHPIIHIAQRRTLLAGDLPMLNSFVRQIVRSLVALDTQVCKELISMREVSQMCQDKVISRNIAEQEKKEKSFKNKAKQLYFKNKTIVKRIAFKVKNKCYNLLRKVKATLTGVKSKAKNLWTVSQNKTKAFFTWILTLLIPVSEHEKELQNENFLLRLLLQDKKLPQSFSNKKTCSIIDLRQIRRPCVIAGYHINPPADKTLPPATADDLSEQDLMDLENS